MKPDEETNVGDVDLTSTSRSGAVATTAATTTTTVASTGHSSIEAPTAGAGCSESRFGFAVLLEGH